MRGFLFGIIVTLVVIVGGAYLFISNGGVPMAASSKPLPLEETVAKMALHASYKNATQEKNPLPSSEANLQGGAKEYREHCAVCHGVPGGQKTAIASGMFPDPPQLFDPKEMVTDDPQGVTYWKVTNGIRLSGMPGFKETLSENDRWQVTMLLAEADKLPAGVKQALAAKETEGEDDRK